jgi:hypothetical protein
MEVKLQGIVALALGGRECPDSRLVRFIPRGDSLNHSVGGRMGRRVVVCQVGKRKVAIQLSGIEPRVSSRSCGEDSDASSCVACKFSSQLIHDTQMHGVEQIMRPAQRLHHPGERPVK